MDFNISKTLLKQMILIILENISESYFIKNDIMYFNYVLKLLRSKKSKIVWLLIFQNVKHSV